jgi:SNF2 family DNA or RNA helicase
MIILHGAWLPDGGAGASGNILLWGENGAAAGHSGRTGALHPFVASAGDLIAALERVTGTGPGTIPRTWREGARILLPSTPDGPRPSPALHRGDAPAALTLQPWKIGGLVLEGATALTVLARLPGRQAAPPPGIALGDSLYFWAQAARLALEMIAGQRFLPAASAEGRQVAAHWEPVFTDTRDLARRRQLIQVMPPSARAVLPPGRGDAPLAPAALLDGFLQQTIADAVRTWALGAPLPSTNQGARLAHEWVLGLLTLDTVAQSTPPAVERFRDQYHAWRDPLQAAVGEAAFRICFRLEPPAADAKPAPKPWTLRYFLQATDDLSLLVPVTTVWRSGGTTLHYLNRRFDRPQERLLAGLGQAGRLFPPIAASLHTAAPSHADLDVAEAYTFLREAGPLLETGGFGVLVPPWWTRRGARPGLKVTLAPGKDKTASGLLGMDSLVAFDWAVALGEDTISPDEFVRLAKLKTPLIQVKGQWVELRPGDADAAIRFWETRGKGGQLTLRDALRLGLDTGDEALAASTEVATPDTGLPVTQVTTTGWLRDLLAQLRGAERPPDLPPPPGLHGTLRPYQLRGVSWLAFLRRWGLGACLADDMGLGKTVQLLALLLHDKAGVGNEGTGIREQGSGISGQGSGASEGSAENGATEPEAAIRANGKRKTVATGSKKTQTTTRTIGSASSNPKSKIQNPKSPVLLICPTSVVGNWQRETMKFAPGLRVLVHHGTGRLAGEAFGETALAHDLVISSYSLTHRDEEVLSAVPWAGVVLDEAQNIKNPEAKQAQAIKRLARGYRIALTGTPVENRLSELWSIMDFLNPGLLGSRNAFRDRYGIPIERYNDPDAAGHLRALVAPFILRRLKTDPTIIQDLPEKQEMKVYCPLTREQATLYEAVVRDALARIEKAEDPMARRGQVLGLLVKLKQICNHPAQFLSDRSALPGRSGKLQRLEEMLEEALAEGDRALIFTQFAEMGGLLQTYLAEQLGVEVLFLHGGTPQKARQPMVERFQSPDGPPLFILSLKAGGVGLNLTAANHVFHFDRWWNPAVENQATDRALRIGQRRNVQVHKFLCNGTVEDKIDALIESKQALAASVIGTGETWLTELSTAQLRDLVALDRDAIIGDGG